MTAEQFVAALPKSRDSFKAKYLDLDVTEENVGYQGRDAFKIMENQTYEY